MPSKVFDFSDQLSEDWISQPRSSDNVPALSPEPLRNNAPQSRIPLPTKAATALTQAKGGAETPSRPSPRPLHVKSKSEFAIPIRAGFKGRSEPPFNHDMQRSHSNHQRSSSAQSWNTDGTVQRFGSDAKNTATNGPMTPEWKRRLLKGYDGQDTKDLFSPVGLEGVFRPPASPKLHGVTTSPKVRRFPAEANETSTIYPSSPPICPRSQRRRATTKSISPTPSHKHHMHDQCNGQGGKCEGATRTPASAQKRTTRRRKGKEEGAERGKENELRQDTPDVEDSSMLADHESISPVTISRGRIDYRSVQASVLHLRNKMEELGMDEQVRPTSRSSDHGVSYAKQRDEDQPPSRPPRASFQEAELSIRDDTFVESSRDSRSMANGDFMQRSFTPTIGPKGVASENDEISWRGSPAGDRMSPLYGARQIKSSPIKPSTGGSPLKLFGKHDTFTNNHLMRRLSQYAGKGIDKPRQRSCSPPSPSPRRDASGIALFHKSRSPSRRFGDEDLKAYRFVGGSNVTGSDRFDDDDDDEPSLPPVLPPKERPKFHIPKKEALDPSRRVSRLMSKRMSDPYSTRRRPQIPSLAEFRKCIAYSDVRSDGKRAMASPGKTHQAKRRRTLLRSVGSPEASSESQAPRLIIGKKRKEAYVPEEAANASAHTLASRAMLRPRSFSSHLTSVPSSPMSSWLGAASSRHASQPAETADVVDQSTKILAEDLATFALNVAQSITKGERKASVTTADFFKEANMIMKRLRGQPPSVSGPISEEASAVEPLPEIMEDNSCEAQITRRSDFEKGGCGHVTAGERSQHEIDETAGSRAEDGLDHDVSASKPRRSRDDSMRSSGLPESDSNVRILERPSGIYVAADAAGEQVQTNSSTNVSISRSMRTGSSTSSSKKFNIAPETVKDILSNQVGRMTFDHEKKVWVRNRAAPFHGSDGSFHPSSEFTEEDPLRSIPDLRDENSPARPLTGQAGLQSDISSNGTIITKSKDARFDPVNSFGSDQVPPQVESRPSSGHGGESSQLSKLSKFGSSQTAPDTRATSWSTMPSTKAQGAAAEPDLPRVREATETPPRESTLTDPKKSAMETGETFKRSAVAFSSPLTTLPDEVLFGRANRDGRARISSPPEQSSVKQQKVAVALARSKDRAKRHLSVVKQRYTDRPVSRIDENEESINGNLSMKEDRTPESSLVLITPQRGHRSEIGDISAKRPPSSRHSSVAFHKTLHLDFLSEFTIHQADESLNLDVNYVRQRHNLASDAEVDSHFSLAVRELIAKVTDIEPFEPYWEYISRIDLCEKKLTTLHMLEDFCPRVQDLLIDDNELGQVNGAPAMLTSISIRNNFLTNVTSWGHLVNLQYLDASGNQVSSLKSFECLIHLRELTLNDNHIETLEGLEHLRGLIKLRLRRNRITHIDLNDVELPRLTGLELSENQIAGKPSLGSLVSLEVLDLHSNNLDSLTFEDSCPSLRSLDLGRNRIRDLDISGLSRLEQLNIDCNELAAVQGLESLRRLSFLSWRAQSLQGSKPIDLTAVREVQSLALSCNKIDLLQLGTAALFNLQSLDLSCCGLDSLPQEFGKLMPNLRRLNLNYNALRDIKALSAVSNLQELHVAGNRILRLRNTANVLAKMGKQLITLDLRTNPLTLGFYAGVGSFPVASSKTWDAQDLRAMAQLTNLVDNELHSAARTALRSDASLRGDISKDKAHRERLDEGTSLRRRVYELLILNHCPSLNIMDGVILDDEGSNRDSDGIWDRLIELGIVKMQLPAPSRFVLTDQPHRANEHHRVHKKT